MSEWENRRWTPLTEQLADLELEITRVKDELRFLYQQKSWMSGEDAKLTKDLEFKGLRPPRYMMPDEPIF